MTPGATSRPTSGWLPGRAVQDRYAEARRANARGVQLYGQGQYARASELLQEALAIDREILGEGHPEIANNYNNLAETLRAQGKQAEAEDMHRRALAIWLKALPEGHPHIATSYNNLAVTLEVQGKYAEAEAMHRRALEFQLKALGEDHPDTAFSYNNLAVNLASPGEVRRGRGHAPPRPGHLLEGPARGAPPHRSELQQHGQ